MSLSLRRSFFKRSRRTRFFPEPYGSDGFEIFLKSRAAPRVAFFFLINLVGGTYIFRNRHRFFDQDSSVDNDIPAIRKLRMEVVMVPWLVLTTLLVILLINFWRA